MILNWVYRLAVKRKRLIRGMYGCISGKAALPMKMWGYPTSNRQSLCVRVGEIYFGTCFDPKLINTQLSNCAIHESRARARVCVYDTKPIFIWYAYSVRRSQGNATRQASRQRWKLNKLLKNLHYQRFSGNVSIVRSFSLFSLDAINKIHSGFHITSIHDFHIQEHISNTNPANMIDYYRAIKDAIEIECAKYILERIAGLHFWKIHLIFPCMHTYVRTPWTSWIARHSRKILHMSERPR